MPLITSGLLHLAPVYCSTRNDSEVLEIVNIKILLERKHDEGTSLKKTHSYLACGIKRFHGSRRSRHHIADKDMQSLGR
jgi:hypothetical protein